MPQNTILIQELSLATVIFEISVLELVKIAMLPKIKQKCPWSFGAPVYLTIEAIQLGWMPINVLFLTH